MVDTLGEIVLSLLTQLKVLHSHLTDELEVLLKFVADFEVVVVELHSSDVRIGCWTHSEHRHSSTVHIQRTVREEVEEEAIIRLLWVSDVLREVVLVAHGIECGRIVD